MTDEVPCGSGEKAAGPDLHDSEDSEGGAEVLLDVTAEEAQAVGRVVLRCVCGWLCWRTEGRRVTVRLPALATELEQ